MLKLLSSKKGGSTIFLVLFIIVFLLLITISLEYHRIYTLKRNVEVDITRALNVAVELSMLDEYRMEHISRIDTTKAKEEFYDYLYSMVVNDEMEKYEDGKFIYKMIIDDIDLKAEPIKFNVKGKLETHSLFLGNFTDMKVVIPFDVKATNRRLDSYWKGYWK